jgi:tetratricopeptide (TPR) repeat protein
VDGARDPVQIHRVSKTGDGVSSSAGLKVAMLNKTSTKRKLTRKEQRDLDIEIGFMEGVIQRDERFVEAWRVLSEDYARRSKFSECLQADEQLARMTPDDPSVLYNLACSYSLAKQIDQSMGALSRAISRGFDDFKWLLKDPDLGNLRKDPTFKKVWVKISSARTKVV